MPRPPSFQSPCRTIREVIGFTQTEMAEELGVSRNTVVKIENGQMKLPEALAHRYQSVTGCELREGGPGEGPLMVSDTWNGEPYTRDVFEVAQLVYKDPAYLQNTEKRIHRMVSQLIAQASESGQMRRLMDDFHVFLSATVKKYEWVDLARDWIESSKASQGE